MTDGSADVDVARIATEALGPEVGLLAGVEAGGFAHSLGDVLVDLARNPAALVAPTSRLAAALAEGGLATVGRMWGLPFPGPMDANGDRRFRDPGWEHNPWFFGLRQWYLAWARYLPELVDAAAVDPPTAAKARFAVGLVVDGLAPTNFLWGNPEALQRAVDTGGESVLAGLRNFIHDVATNGGKPSQVDASAFRLGENLAATPGKVVFRNE
ncbi:MAG: poly-beta-hydroxybutyrate polymerase, partial [Acidimicrobiales bacterium]